MGEPEGEESVWYVCVCLCVCNGNIAAKLVLCVIGIVSLLIKSGREKLSGRASCVLSKGYHEHESVRVQGVF